MKHLLNILFVVFIIIATIEPTYAYLDPGTGSMIIQAIAASLAFVALFFKSIWANITRFFGKKPKSIDDEDDD